MSPSSAVPNIDTHASLQQRRPHSSKSGGHEHHDHKGGDASPTSSATSANSPHQDLAHQHSHSIFSGHHHHHHAADEDETEQLLQALKGKGDRGSNITLIGLGANVGLTAAKGAAGVALNSAALLADAAHSMSDMISDFVTLFCWKLSRKPPSATHPMGYGKYETMGSLGVSVLLVAGAIGIGFHSYHLLLEAIQPTIAHAPAAVRTAAHAMATAAEAGAHLGHEHHLSTEEHGVLDPNAMWFALASIVIKEWLYRATLKIAKEEDSSVLEANALHHRSDAYSSGVTLLTILGSWAGFPVLDPLGGLLVAGIIGKQGMDVFLSAVKELSDRGVEPEVLRELSNIVSSMQSAEPNRILGFRDLKALKSGVSTFVDLKLDLPASIYLKEAHDIESRVRKAIMDQKKGVREVRIHLHAVEDGKEGEVHPGC